METKDILTVVSLFIGFLSLYIGLNNSKKTTFINSITASRIRWIDTLRNTISEFCGLTYHYALTHHELDLKEKNLLREKVDKLRFLIKLQLNRNDSFDKLIISKVETLPQLADGDHAILLREIDGLINLTQDLLKLEWEGAKSESQKGNLTSKEKQELYEKHLKMQKHSG